MYKYFVKFMYAGEEMSLEAQCSVCITSETFIVTIKDFARFVIGDYLRINNLQKEGDIPYGIKISKWNEDSKMFEVCCSFVNLID